MRTLVGICVAGTLLLSGLATRADKAPLPLVAYVPERYTLSVPCNLTLAPDMAVIIAGFSARGLKAVEAGARLDEIGKAIEKRAAELGGKTTLKERLRGAKTVTLRGDKEETPPYVAVQLVEIEFPVGAEIDRALDALIPLGLDRFGKRAALEPTNETNPIVYYRVASLKNLTDTGFAVCKQEAHATTCARQGHHPICKVAEDKATRCLRVDSVMLRSDINDGRYRESVSIDYPGRSMKPVEGASKGPFVFAGTAMVSYAVSCVER